jgi:hypothetical protein
MHSRILCADISSNTEICFPNFPIHGKVYVSDCYLAGSTVLRFCLSQLLLAKAKIVLRLCHDTLPSLSFPIRNLLNLLQGNLTAPICHH